jgi:acetyl esterase/lipase
MFSEPSHPLHTTDFLLSKANLYPYLLEDAVRPGCVLVLPGGGYGGVSHQEGPPVAGWLNSMGVAAVVLEYTVGQGVYPAPQQQALYAVRYLRAHAEALNIDPDKIGVIGFSAGGHLAACVANGFDRPEWLLDPDGCLEGTSARPDAAILAYPVISSGPFAHVGSFDNLLGVDATPEQRAEFSWEHHVHADAPPHFLWHTASDMGVPPENSYLMAMGLSAAKIPHELHVYPEGAHWLGLCSIGGRRQGSAVQWKAQAETWLLARGF